ncbi:MAG: hypothetical protein QOE70_3408 [Chthoniobacter sp.]|jgi:hypothetical protein|nr:hypothetical protein [Chthoniobacter sp.]
MTISSTELRHAGECLGELDTLTAEAQRAIDLLQERRAALISSAVTGQIDVYRDRLDEQAAYFRITREEATEIARQAAAFTEERLELFSVWTRRRAASGHSALARVYCIVIDATRKE